MTIAARPKPGGHPATLIGWLRPDGSHVAGGEPICRVESDKAAADLVAPRDGVLRHLAAPGDRVATGDEVARIDPLP